MNQLTCEALAAEMTVTIKPVHNNYAIALTPSAYNFAA